MKSLSLGGIVDVRVPDLAAAGVPYVVEVGGDLDIASVDDLEGPVIHAIRDGREPVILDLSECGFIDSSGIRLVLRAHHLLRERADPSSERFVVVESLFSMDGDAAPLAKYAALCREENASLIVDEANAEARCVAGR